MSSTGYNDGTTKSMSWIPKDMIRLKGGPIGHTNETIVAKRDTDLVVEHTSQLPLYNNISHLP